MSKTTKKEVIDEISNLLGVALPPLSTGSTESREIFEIINRLAKIYLESYPEDQEGLERFLRWAHAQYGYKYGNS